MQSHLEESLQQDIDLIRSKVMEMGGLVENALRTSMEAIKEKNRQLAYVVILRDRYIDELETELDWLCLKFLVKHQPAASHLRFAYGVIKMNTQLERSGDYAESIARQFLALSSIEPQPSYQRIVDIANLAIPLLHDAIQAFAEADVGLAVTTRTKEKDKTIDNLRHRINEELTELHGEGRLPSEALAPLMTIATRFERVGDQAGNICEEVLYMCTGEEIRHQEKDVLRVLFVDEGDACRAQMAEGIGNALGLEDVQFSSAGTAPRPVDARTVEFMAEHGIDISGQTSKHINQILGLKGYEAIISLCKEAESVFSSAPLKTVRISWEVQDASKVEGSEEEVQAAYEATFQYLDTHIRDLVQAILGNDIQKEEQTDVQ